MRQKSLKLFILVVLAILLSSCGIPVPADKMNYVGEWEGPGIYLQITADGRVKYKRIQKGMTKSLEAPIRRFEKDDFVVGIPGMSTTFMVNTPPYKEHGQWKMVVDGNTLIKSGGGGGGDETI